jgi:hypothetical protein
MKEQGRKEAFSSNGKHAALSEGFGPVLLVLDQVCHITGLHIWVCSIVPRFLVCMDSNDTVYLDVADGQPSNRGCHAARENTNRGSIRPRSQISLCALSVQLSTLLYWWVRWIRLNASDRTPPRPPGRVTPGSRIVALMWHMLSNV